MRKISTSGLTADRVNAIRTFVIADVRGYTTFTREHGDEAAARLTGKFAEIAREAVEAFDGELIEASGDEFLAAFDSVRRALRAAVELQDAFRLETLLDPSLPLNVGMGVAAGEAVSVEGGYRGGALNFAARLCARAQAGEVLGSSELASLAGTVAGVRFQPLEPVELKGFDRPVPVLRLVADAVEPLPAPAADVRGRRPELPPGLDVDTPLAGRARELRFLRWSWRRARHGRGRAVFVSGPSGIGKTRLAAEIATAAHGEGADVLYALCAGPAAEAIAAIAAAAAIERPTLLVADDIDAAGGGVLDALSAVVAELRGRSLLLLVTYEESREPLASLVIRPDSAEEAHVQLAPLDAREAYAIAASYAGGANAALPLAELYEESGGVPAEVHRFAGRWAQERAAGRLSTAVSRAASERHELRSAELEVAANVIEHQRARERARAAAEAAQEAVICPFKGLATFETADAEFFFGRERLVAELVARLVGTRFLGVIGPSGSGKSSAVRAGLLPALAAGVLPGSERWVQRLVRPGERLPTAAGEPLLLVVDQFEELFTTVVAAERRLFVETLVGREDVTTVVVALRADFYGRCAEYPELARLLGSNQVLVGPMEAEELRQAIELPARRAGLRVEPELAEALVADVADEPGALPLLSSALLELWQQRRGRVLTLDRYRDSGGVRGAIARLAETAYGQLTPDQQQLARAVFLRLTGPGAGETLVRRRAPLDELDLDADPDVARVLSVLTDGRLLTVGEDTVELAHEALLREWPRLRGWLEEDAEGRRLHLHLMEQAREWAQRGRDDADLYRGARLASALEWRSSHTVELNEREGAFLDQSHAASDRDAERQRQANRRLRMLLAGVAGLLLAAVLAGLFALAQRANARDEARVATARGLAAAAEANLEVDPERSLHLAIAAVETTRRKDGTVLREAEEALHAALARARTIVTVRALHGRSVDFAPDGRHFVVDGVVYDATANTPVVRLRGGMETLRFVEYTPDSRQLATAHADGTVRLWDAATGRLVKPFAKQDSGLLSAQFEPDGREFVTVTELGDVRVWDMATGVLLQSFRAFEQRALLPKAELTSLSNVGRLLAVAAHPTGKETAHYRDLVARVWDRATGVEVLEIRSDAFGPHDVEVDLSGSLLAAGSQSGDIGLWRVPTGEPVGLVAGHDANVFDVELSADGSLLATASADGTAKVWQVSESGLREKLSLAGHASWVVKTAFSPDGKSLLTASQDGTARLWDISATGGGELAAFPGAETPLWGEIAFYADGQRLIAPAGPEGTVRVWDVKRGTQLLSLIEHVRGIAAPRAVAGVHASPDGSRIATASFDQTARLFDGDNGATLRIIRDHESDCPPRDVCAVSAVAFSPDGATVATTSDDGTVRLFAADTGKPIRVIDRGDRERSLSVAFSPDGERVAAPSWSGTAGVWDVDSGRQLLALRHAGGQISSARYSADGTRLATAGSDGQARIWNAADGSEIRRIGTAQSGVYDAVFSPNGAFLATAGADGTIKLWDVASGAERLTLRETGATRIVFSPDGTLLAGNGGISRVVKVWVLDVERLIELARERVTRPLTDEECRRYLHIDRCRG